jgi:hypothetical protein
MRPIDKSQCRYVAASVLFVESKFRASTGEPLLSMLRARRTRHSRGSAAPVSDAFGTSARPRVQMLQNLGGFTANTMRRARTTEPPASALSRDRRCDDEARTSA